MTIKSKIQKYIEEEKQLSEYKVQLLKTGEQKQYKDRLILKEEDFINFDFSKISFASLEDVRGAVLLFKTSREEFDEKYGDSKKKSLEKISSFEIDILNRKLLFFEEKCKWILDSKVKEINIIDNLVIRSLLKDDSEDFTDMSIQKMKKVEGSSVGKYRARIQILLYCISRYFFSEIKKIKAEIAEKEYISYLYLRDLNIKLYLIFENYSNFIYQYFNRGKKELPSLLVGSNGENDYIDSIHDLINIVNDINLFEIKKISDKSIEVFNKDGSMIQKRSSDRAYGINTEIKRIGNESINILYMDVYTKSGNNITNLLENSFFNNYIKGDYVKSISTVPLNILLSTVESNKELLSDFSQFFYNDKIDYEKINKGSITSVLLSRENSIILVAETRSDAEHLAEAEKSISILINSFKKEYQERFSYYLPDSLENDNRKGNLKKFLEQKNANG